MKAIYNQKLFCPGPVNISGAVKQASIAHDIGHRELEFSQLFVSVKKKLFSIFEISSVRDFSALLITGSGTAANEAVLSSVVGDKKILVLTNGEFGQRLLDISSFHNKNTLMLDFGWGKAFDLDVVEKCIVENKVEMLAVVHHETSTGMLNPVDKLGKICRKHRVTLIVDAVSSAGCERVRVEDWNISYLTTSVGKAICSMPGLGIIVGRKTEFEKLKDIKPKTIYLDLYKIYKFSKFFTQTPNTPAVNLIFALDAALDAIVRVGIKNKIDRVKKTAHFARLEMKKMGLKFFVEENLMSNMLTTVLAPFDVALVQAKLKERGYVIYKGKGPLEKKVFQVANIGEITVDEMRNFLGALREVLDEFTGVAETDYDEVSVNTFADVPLKRFSLRMLFKN